MGPIIAFPKYDAVAFSPTSPGCYCFSEIFENNNAKVVDYFHIIELIPVFSFEMVVVMRESSTGALRPEISLLSPPFGSWNGLPT